MTNNLVRYVVKRYLRFDKNQPFITISAILAFLGVMIGVAVLMVSMAIMNGMIKDFKDKISTMNYPITIISSKEAIGLDDVTDLENKFPNLKFSPYIYSQAIIRKDNDLEGGVIYGVDFNREREVNKYIAEAIKDKKVKKYDLIIGKSLEESLFIDPFSDRKAILIFTQTDPLGISIMPRMKRFNVIGTFDSGLRDYDKGYMFTPYQSLTKILKYEPNRFDGIHIYSPNPMEDIKKLKEVLPPYTRAIGWWELNKTFFGALALEKKALFLVLVLIIVVASLNIVSSLLMTVMSRRREIALLLSLGAYKHEIKKIFLYLGITIGGSGIIIGMILGFSSIYALDTFNIISLPKEVYGTSKLPLDLATSDFISIIVGAVVIVLLSSYYPAKKATTIDVLSTLRNE